MRSSLLKQLTMMALATLVGVLPACKKKQGCTDPNAINYDADAEQEDGTCEYDESIKAGVIGIDETWGADRIYYLQGKVIIPAGVTLTILPGTIIKGKVGTETNASALIVAKGGKLIANGTASQPIIFTSELDDIQLGQTVGTNLSKTQNEKWGGVVILGNAPVSTENGDTQGNIEGIPADLGYGLYGGNDPNDNSGSLSYVSIRHGGVTIGEGNELNALTLGGVGAGTTINNIEIYATLDDGVECFGGTVDLQDVLVFYQGDDGIDIDQNYAGTINGFAVLHGDGVGTDEGLEIDGPEGSTYTDGQFTLINGICRSLGNTDGSAADFKSKAQGTLQNVTFDYSSVGGKPVKFRTRFDASCTHRPDAFQYLTAPSGSHSLSLTNCSVPGGVLVYDGDADPNTACPTELDAAQTAAQGMVGTGSGSSYDYVTKFSWGAASARGEL